MESSNKDISVLVYSSDGCGVMVVPRDGSKPSSTRAYAESTSEISNKRY